jgi:alginate O-acetyltransferase complex protein AlgI
LLLGFHFPINFNSPYQARNITEFWRRWHISLSTWLRDYLYISLDGNRKGKVKTYVNQMITMLLGGLWHGASWRFLIWGTLHGFALVVHKIFRVSKSKVEDTRSRILFKTILTFHFVCFCWIFFRASSLEIVGQMLTQMVTEFHGNILFDFISGYKGVMTMMAIGYVLHFIPQSVEHNFQQRLVHMNFGFKVAWMLLIILIVIQTKSAGIQPFIYFQF